MHQFNGTTIRIAKHHKTPVLADVCNVLDVDPHVALEHLSERDMRLAQFKNRNNSWYTARCVTPDGLTKLVGLAPKKKGTQEFVCWLDDVVGRRKTRDVGEVACVLDHVKRTSRGSIRYIEASGGRRILWSMVDIGAILGKSNPYNFMRDNVLSSERIRVRVSDPVVSAGYWIVLIPSDVAIRVLERHGRADLVEVIEDTASPESDIIERAIAAADILCLSGESRVAFVAKTLQELGDRNGRKC